MPKVPQARSGSRLKIKGSSVAFSFWPTTSSGGQKRMQFELLVNNPWDVIRNEIRTKASSVKARRKCLAFVEQSFEFFVASQNFQISSKPLLLYYSFLNLAKAFVQFENPGKLHFIQSIYAMIFYLGSITRYRPASFDRIQQSPFGSMIDEVISSQGQQFLYLMAS